MNLGQCHQLNMCFCLSVRHFVLLPFPKSLKHKLCNLEGVATPPALVLVNSVYFKTIITMLLHWNQHGLISGSMSSSGGNPGSCVLEQRTEKRHRDTAEAEHRLLGREMFSRKEGSWVSAKSGNSVAMCLTEQRIQAFMLHTLGFLESFSFWAHLHLYRISYAYSVMLSSAK